MAFDVCVIGSGPAGGVLSKELAEAGAKVALVEAGRVIKFEEFQYHAWPYELPFRGRRRPGTPPPAYPKEVRESIRYQDCDNISVDRIRAVGGRSIHWNAVCLRFAERDFRERSLEGIEEDWPLTYQELAPDYSHVERMIGVTGSRENLDIIPDGEFLPPLNLRCSEQIVKRACGKMGIRMIPARKAVLTRPYDNRPPCHYCGRCMEGCDVGAVFSTPVSMFPKAMKTGNFTLLANKIVRELQVDREGRVKSASVIDATTRKEEEIEASIFAVCCGAPESARLLLNSRSPQFSHGLANSNDMVGRYLHGNVAANVIGYLQDLVGTKPVNNDGATDHTYIPRFNHLSGKKNGYSGGFHYQLNYAGFLFPNHCKIAGRLWRRIQEAGQRHAARLRANGRLGEGAGAAGESSHRRSQPYGRLGNSDTGLAFSFLRERCRAVERHGGKSARDPACRRCPPDYQYTRCASGFWQP